MRRSQASIRDVIATQNPQNMFTADEPQAIVSFETDNYEPGNIFAKADDVFAGVKNRVLPKPEKNFAAAAARSRVSGGYLFAAA